MASEYAYLIRMKIKIFRHYFNEIFNFEESEDLAKVIKCRNSYLVPPVDGEEESENKEDHPLSSSIVNFYS